MKLPCRASRRLAAALLAALLSACQSPLPPSATTPGQVADAAYADATRIGVCYNRLMTSPKQVRAVAAADCGAGTEPVLAGQEMDIDCPLLTPVRATFVCAAP